MDQLIVLEYGGMAELARNEEKLNENQKNILLNERYQQSKIKDLFRGQGKLFYELGEP